MASQHSNIFNLPDDLVEILFITCVHSLDPHPTSPVTLSQVCRKWRSVAHQSARLWTNIDLGHAERAKHFVALSKDAGLRVTWTNWSPRSHSTLNMNSRDWIWGQAHRFVALELVGSSELVRHVLSRVEEELPMLRHLDISVQDASLALRRHIPLALILARVVTLFLSALRTSVQDVVRTLRSAHNLEVLQLSRVELTESNLAESSSPAKRATGQLRYVDLGLSPVDAQPAILSALPALPSNLTIDSEAADPEITWPRILHPMVSHTLYPIKFSTLYCHYRYMELRADPDANDDHTRLTLRATGAFFPVLLRQETEMFDFSNVHTLELDDVRDTFLEALGSDILKRTRRVTKVVLHRSWFSAALIASLPDLRELRIKTTELRLPGSIRLLEEILGGLWRRKEPQMDGTILPPLKRVVLEGCRGVQYNESVALLQSEIEINIIR